MDHIYPYLFSCSILPCCNHCIRSLQKSYKVSKKKLKWWRFVHGMLLQHCRRISSFALVHYRSEASSFCCLGVLFNSSGSLKDHVNSNTQLAEVSASKTGDLIDWSADPRIVSLRRCFQNPLIFPLVSCSWVLRDRADGLMPGSVIAKTERVRNILCAKSSVFRRARLTSSSTFFFPHYIFMLFAVHTAHWFERATRAAWNDNSNNAMNSYNTK